MIVSLMRSFFFTYRLFFETEGRKYGRNLSWSCTKLFYIIINNEMHVKIEKSLKNK